jgi:hypothetical protein
LHTQQGKDLGWACTHTKCPSQQALKAHNKQSNASNPEKLHSTQNITQPTPLPKTHCGTELGLAMQCGMRIPRPQLLANMPLMTEWGVG